MPDDIKAILGSDLPHELKLLLSRDLVVDLAVKIYKANAASKNS